MTNIENIALDLCGNDFLLPYLERELLREHADDAPIPIIGGIRICTDETEGNSDPEVDRYCMDNQLPLAVLRCRYIVGTGMRGLMMKIAAGINRGTFVHIAGNEARISVVHAVDVARAVSIAAGVQGTFTLTDTTDPTIHNLAEALAYRLNNKRIITIKPRWARWWYGSSYYNVLTYSHTSPCTFCEVFPDFHPANVTEYLTTHIYDESSL